MTASLIKQPNVDQWLVISSDGRVIVRSGKVDIGQRISTALAAIAAEELDLPIIHERLILGRAVIVRQKDFLLHLGSLGLAINVRQIQFLRHLALHGRSVYPRR